MKVLRFLKEGIRDPLLDYDFYASPVIIGEHETYAQAFLRQEPPFLMIEHDIIINAESFPVISRYTRIIHDTELLVFPYYLYPSSTNLKHPVIAHRHQIEWIRHQYYFQIVDSFGLGCIYVPSMYIFSLINPLWDYPDFDSNLSEAVHSHVVTYCAPNPIVTHVH
jgi:hypothetical protein